MPRLTNIRLAGFSLSSTNSLDTSLLTAVSFPSTVGRSSESNVLCRRLIGCHSLPGLGLTQSSGLPLPTPAAADKFIGMQIAG